MHTPILQRVYQVVITALGVLVVYWRRSSIFGPAPTNVDVLLLSIVAVLCIWPLVKEITLGGITLKKELENTKRELMEKLGQLRNELVNKR